MIPELLRVLAATDDSGGGPDIGKPIGQFAHCGPVGVFLIQLILGVIVPKYVMSALMTEKDNWREAFEKERDAHQAPREQLVKAEERGDVAVDPPCVSGRTHKAPLISFGR
ncbi:hypothetical protein [Streptomyces mirabilis]|uniref:hypothetical protein n=1 Tax=Streptomyces mirabilis TaxID=68239 RepID=UPI0022597B78|nr:hypothetical protein [Streptomyces mirabilis]MCX4608729.1 hypothetical protein [Streptomyces mirabilis]